MDLRLAAAKGMACPQAFSERVPPSASWLAMTYGLPSASTRSRSNWTRAWGESGTRKKLTKTEKGARRLQRDAQELDRLVKSTAAAFRSSYETGEDCAAECDHRRDDLLADLDYRRLTYEIWRGRPGAEALESAIADLLAENERHLAAILHLCRRFDDLSKNQTWHETLGPDVVPDDLIRSRLFSDPPT